MTGDPSTGAIRSSSSSAAVRSAFGVRGFEIIFPNSAWRLRPSTVEDLILRARLTALPRCFPFSACEKVKFFLGSLVFGFPHAADFQNRSQFNESAVAFPRCGSFTHDGSVSYGHTVSVTARRKKGTLVDI
jgi:hypothetical protein